MKFFTQTFIIASWLFALAHAQPYQVGVPVCDTISTITRYDETFCHPNAPNHLSVAYDQRLAPYVTGLRFEFHVTSIEGTVSSNVSDTVWAGDVFLIPAGNDSAPLRFILSPNSAFEFIAKIAGTPTITGEAYPCEIRDSITAALCSNGLAYGAENNSDTCRVEPANSVHAQSELPTGFALLPNHPNPFHLATSIQYAVASEQLVSLKVYDVLGNEVATLVEQRKPAGNYRETFAAHDLPNGIYFIQMTVGKFVTRRKMLVLR